MTWTIKGINRVVGNLKSKKERSLRIFNSKPMKEFHFNSQGLVGMAWSREGFISSILDANCQVGSLRFSLELVEY